MTMGETCVEIPKLGGAYPTPKRYCDDCFKQVLQKTSEDLAELGNL
jgi:hypothetical protein